MASAEWRGTRRGTDLLQYPRMEVGVGIGICLREGVLMRHVRERGMTLILLITVEASAGAMGSSPRHF